jgi:hypothetical protein
MAPASAIHKVIADSPRASGGRTGLKDIRRQM